MKSTPSKLGDAIDILSGFAYPAELFNDDVGIPVIRIRDVVRGFSETRYSGPVEQSYVINNGEILIGMDGNFNAARWCGGPALLNQRVCRVKARPNVLDEGYLFHLLPRALKKIEDSTAFVTVKHLSVKGIRDIDVDLPPLAEQCRIAAILDQADALRAKRREALAQVESLTQSIFIEMFGDPVTNPKGWPSINLGALIHSASDGPHVSPTYAETGIPFLSARHVRPGEISWGDMKFLSQSEAEIQWKKCKPIRDDILYTKGGTTGFAAVVNTDVEFAVWVHIALLKPNKSMVNSKWLETMLNSPYCYRQSQEFTHGIANRDLGLKRMVNILMYHPPLEVQEVFAHRMKKLGEQQFLQRRALAELELLFASLQHRAFAGAL